MRKPETGNVIENCKMTAGRHGGLFPFVFSQEILHNVEHLWGIGFPVFDVTIERDY